MSSENLTGIYNSDLEHEHLLDSDRAGWNKLGLIYELEPAGEMPEEVTFSHVLVVCQKEFQASFKIAGQWHHQQYTKGDIALFAAGELFPRVKTDREVPLTVLKQKSSPNKAQASFISGEYVAILVEPLDKTIRYSCTKCL